MKVLLSDALIQHADFFRDAILAMISNLKKMNKKIPDPLKRAKTIHESIDKLIKSELERSHIEVACKKGCSGCCSYMDIMATRDEVKLIKSTLSGKLPKDKEGHCQFLKDGACSIYEVRPGACRKLIATSFPCTKRFVIFPAEVVWSAYVTVNGGELIHKGNHEKSMVERKANP